MSATDTRDASIDSAVKALLRTIAQRDHAAQVARVEAVLTHARAVSPSPRQVVYVVDVQAALDGDGWTLDYYDRQGNPVTLGQLVGLYRIPDYKRVALTERDGVRVSTIWLGINHQWGDGPPIIFETMVFGTDDEDNPQWRYSTEAQARAGHAEVCSAYLRGRA